MASVRDAQKRRPSSLLEPPRPRAEPTPPAIALSPENVLALQRTIGNRATRALIARKLSAEDRAAFEKQLRAKLGLVAPDPLGACLHPVASMSEEWSEGGQTVPIAWTGGAASCVAVGLYRQGKAALCHIDPQKIGEANAPLPKWFVEKLREFDRGVMHLSSGRMVEFLQLLQAKISALPDLAFTSLHTYTSARLALNAATVRSASRSTSRS